MSAVKEDGFHGSNKERICRDDFANMGYTESKKYTNYALCAASGVVIAVFSLVLFLAAIQYRSDMDVLRRSVDTLRSDILIQLASDREHYDSNHAHKLHRRDTKDIVVDKTISLVDQNFTQFDDAVKDSLQVLDDMTERITGIRNDLKDTKKNFSNDISRIERLMKKAPNCSLSPLAYAQGNEIISLVLKLTNTISSLKRVMVLSTLKSATVRGNHALLKRFECTLKDAMAQMGDRIEALEGMGHNLTSHSTELDGSLDNIRMDIKQMHSRIKIGKDEIIKSINAKLDVTQSKCTNKDFLETVFDDLKSDVNGITDSTRAIQDKLLDISGKTTELSSGLSDTHTMLQSLKASQTQVGDTCASNGDQAIAILDKLDLFNVSEPVSEFTYTEYCAERQGCVRVKSSKKHCYKIFDTLSDSWYGATETCNKEGGYLVEINSDVEYQKLATFITRTRYYWIGGTDLNSEGSWYWSNSKERVWLNAWRGRNPSNDGGVEHCMHLYANRISWNDANCLVRQSFICEKETNCDGWD